MKSRLKQLLPKNKFARSVSVLAGGAAGAQVIVIAASPILTRLYTPDDFGLFAVYAAFLAILGVVASMRYQLAIPLPKCDGKALHIVVLSFLILFALTLVLTLAVFIFGNYLVQVLNTPKLERFLWLIPIGFVLAGIYDILQYWFLRSKSFNLISKMKVLQSTCVACLQILGASLGAIMLIGGRVMSQILTDIILLRSARPLISRVKGTVNLKGLVSVAREYRQFPIYSSWAGLLNASGAQVPPIFFAAMFSPAAAGGYMLAQRVINLPLSVIGTAISDVFLPSSIDAHREKKLATHVGNLILALASLMFPIATLLFFIAPPLFQLVFGDNWRIAGEIVRWLSPMLAIQFLINPVSRIFVTIERQDLALLLQGCLFLLRLLSFFVIYLFGLSLIDAVQLFSLASILGYAVYFFYIFKVTGMRFFEFFISFRYVFLSVMLVLFFCLFSLVLFGREGYSFIVSLAGGSFISVISTYVAYKRMGIK